MTPDWWQTLSPLAQHLGRLQVMRDFVTLSACALSGGERETEYIQTLEKYLGYDYDLFSFAFGQLLFERSLDPYTDTLGPLYTQFMDAAGEKYPRASYPIYSSAELLAMVTFAEELYEPEPAGQVTLFDPACGAGALLLQGVKIARNTRPGSALTVCAADPDFHAAQMSVINLSLAEVPGTVASGGVTYQTNTKLRQTYALLSGVETLVNTFKGASL